MLFPIINKSKSFISILNAQESNKVLIPSLMNQPGFWFQSYGATNEKALS